MLRLAVVAAGLAAAAVCAQTSYFVSPSGNDASGDGSYSKPWQTIPRAQQAVRGVNQNMQADVVVNLLPGLYPVSQALTFTPADSGSNGYTVHYTAYGGGPAVIHGGVPITGWQVYNSSGAGVWVAPLPVADTRQVYVAGNRVNKTRTGGGIPGTLALHPWGYTTTDQSVLEWASSELEFLYTGVGSSWTECRVRVSSIAPATDGSGLVNITMQQPAFANAVNKFFGQGVTYPANVENAWPLVASGGAPPGSGYWSSEEGKVYYVPLPGQSINDPSLAAYAASTEVLLQMSGDRWAASGPQRVQNIALEGLTFSYAGWLDPNGPQGRTGPCNGYVDMQSGFRLVGANPPSPDWLWTPVPGNVQLSTVGNVTVTGCVFTHMGAAALVVDQGSQGVTIDSNNFTDISCGGLRVGQVDDYNLTDSTRFNANFTVSNNYFQGIGQEFRDCAALLGGYTVNATIQNNEIASPPNTGISWGWGWSRDDANCSSDNRLLNNWVHGSNWLLEDGGSFYVLGPQPRSEMAYNYASCQVKLFGSLYTDEGSAYWDLHHNVVNNVPEWLHIWTESIHDETVTDNWTNQPYQVNHGTNITEANNTVLASGQPWPDDAIAVMTAAGLRGSGVKPTTC